MSNPDRRHILIMYCSCLVSCGAAEITLPRHLEQGRHPRYPENEWLTASGTSLESQDAAAASARAEVCRQVRNHIIVTSEDTISLAARGEEVRSYERFVQKVKQKADCDFGGLIRVVPDLSGHRGGEWWAFTALSRREAIDYLRPKFDTVAPVFADRAGAAIAAESDPVAFTSAYNEAQAAFRTLSEQSLLIRSLARDAFEPYKRALVQEGALLVAAARVRSDTTLTVHATGPDPRGLAAAVAELAKQSGVNATAGADCRKGLLLVVSATEECSSRLGLCCEWHIAGQACDCGRQRCAPFTLGDVKGCDRGDEQTARREVVSEVARSVSVSSALRSALASVLPISSEQ